MRDKKMFSKKSLSGQVSGRAELYGDQRSSAQPWNSCVAYSKVDWHKTQRQETEPFLVCAWILITRPYNFLEFVILGKDSLSDVGHFAWNCLGIPIEMFLEC